MPSTISASFTNPTQTGIRPLKSFNSGLGKSIILRGNDAVFMPTKRSDILVYEFGKCLKSNSSKYVTVTHAASLNRSGVFGFEFWINGDVTSNIVIYDKSDYTSGVCSGERIEITAARKLKWTVGNGTLSTYLESFPIAYSGWHHVFMYYDSTDANPIKIYIDSFLDSEGGTTGISIASNTEDIELGNTVNATNVYIDEFRMFNGINTSSIGDRIKVQRAVPLSAYPNGTGSGEKIGDLTCHFRFDESSGSTFYDETANSNDGTCVGGTCADLQDTNTLLPGDNTDTVNNWTGTAAFRVKLNSFNGDIPLFWKAYDNIRIEIWIQDDELFFITQGRYAIQLDGITISDYADEGEWFSIVCCWDFLKKYDGTNYINLFVNGTSVKTWSVNPSYSWFRTTEILQFSTGTKFDYYGAGTGYLPYPGTFCGFDGFISYQIDSFPWYDTIANAEAAGFPQQKSVEYWGTGSSFNVPFIDQYTKSALLPETGSNDYPKLITSVLNVALAEDTETTDSSTHLQAMVTGIPENFFEGQYLLIYVPAQTKPASYYSLYEVCEVETVTDNGDGTVTLTFTGELLSTNRGNYTVANKTFITNNLIYDGLHSFCGGEHWSAGASPATVSLQKTYFDYQHSGGKGICSYTSGGKAEVISDWPDYDVSFLFSTVYRIMKTGDTQNINIVFDGYDGSVLILSGNLSSVNWNCYEISGFNGAINTIGVRISGNRGAIGDIYLFQNLLSNAGLDDTYSSGLASGWSKTGTPTVTESSDIHSGTASGGAHTQYSQSVNGGIANYVYQDVTVEAERWYTISGWVKGNSGIVAIINGTESKVLTMGTSTSGWRKYGHTLKSQGTTVTIRIYGNGSAALFDDFSMIRLFTEEAHSGDLTTESERYVANKSGTAQSAFLCHNDIELSYAADGVLRTDKGSIAFLIKPPCKYDSADEDFYLMEIEEVFRLYYDASDMKFKFSVYDGSSWNTAESIKQKFLGGEWLWVFAIYDNTSGIWVHGSSPIEADDKTAATWDAQSVTGKDIFLFSDKDGNYPFDGIADYPHGYDEILSIGAMKKFYNMEF